MSQMVGEEYSTPARARHSVWSRGAKRTLDIALAGVGLAVASPVMIAVAVAIKLDSPGPVFFEQRRAGRNGASFDMVKFRSMRVPTPEELAAVDMSDTSNQRDVARVTRLGGMLRRTKLDELPQLLNVLRGDMSLVGPRPTFPEQAALYDAHQRRRLEVRPGITGLAQVNGSAAIPWDERIEYDVYYVDHVDLRMDLSILVKTLVVVLLGEGRFARSFAESGLSTTRQEPR
jgi:undecaprenyl phosphate N,N'-diacetylbacillosamine 1-phosphate transferase